MTVNARKFGRLTTGVQAEHPPTPENVPQEARVLSVSAAGALVELTSLPGQSQGPCPFLVGAYATAALAVTAGACPQPGDLVLVVFAGVGIGQPWVISWTR